MQSFCKFLASPRATINQPNQPMKLPTTLTEIRNAASSMLNDKAVTSVNVQTTFGLVTVFRDGQIRCA
jgi:hypothetical protein